MLTVVAGGFIGAPAVFAQSVHTWNGNGTDDNWSTTANWVSSSAPDGNDEIHFAGTMRLTPNNDTALAGYRIFFDSGAGAFTLGGNAFNLFDFGGNSPKIENSSTSIQTINMAITLDGSPGAGSSAEINPVNGDLVFGSTVTLADAGNTQLRIFGNNGNTVTFNGVISGDNSVAINQNSNVVYNAANTYTGDTFVNAGDLRFGAGGSVSSGFIRIGNDGVADSPAATVSLVSPTGGQTISTPFVIRPSASGTVGTRTIRSTNTSGTNTLSGNMFLDADLTISADDAGGALTVSGATLDLKNQTMTVTGPGNTTISGVLDNPTAGQSGKLLKSGTGVLTLSGTNTYRGSTTISDGVLSIASEGALGMAPVVATDGQVTFGGGTLRGTSSFTLASTRNVQFNVGSGTYDVASGQTLTVAGVQKGTGGYNKTGAGVLVLSSTASTVTGAVSVTGGVLQIASSGAIGGTGVGAGNITLDGGTFRNAATGGSITFLTGNRGFIIGASGGTIEVPGSSANTQIYTSGSITGPGNTLTKSGPGTFRNMTPTSITFTKLVVTAGLYQAGVDNIFGAVPGSFLADAITLDGGGISINAGFSFSANRGITINAGNGTFSGTSNGSITSIVSGSGGLTKALSGALTLSGNNTFGGGLTVIGGTVHLNHDNAAGTGVITSTPVSAVTIRNSVVGSTIANDIVINAGAAGTDFFATTGNTLTLNGVISGAANWTRGAGGGAGNVVLGGASANTFTGNLSISSGGLTVAKDNALGTISGTTTVNSGGALNFQGNLNYTNLEPISVAGTGVSSTGAINNLSGDNTFGGPVTMTAASNVGVTSGNLELAGVISGAFQLTKVGPGTLVLSNPANTYLRTTISAGVLSVSSDANLGTAPGAPTVNNLIISGGATLYASEDFTLNRNRGINLLGGAGTVDVAPAKTVVYNGEMVGDNLAKAGTGALQLGGANTYTGTTSVNAGVLRVNGTHTGGGAYTVASGATLGGSGVITPLSGASVTLDGAVAPGSSVGQLTLATSGGGETVFAPGGSYDFEIESATGTAGTDWDHLALSSLNITATSLNRFVVKIFALPGTGGPELDNFNPDSPFSWVIATASSGSIPTFDLTKFTIETTNFESNNLNKGGFYLDTSGGDLHLRYVPEPGAGMTALLGAALLLRRRRRVGGCV